MVTLPQRSSLPAPDVLSDEEIAQRVLSGERALFELLMRRHNQRVYRAVRSLVRDEGEVEEVMQAAYVSAYLHLSQFSGAARFSTWLLRIAVNEALMRLRREKRFVALEEVSDEEDAVPDMPDQPNPEESAERRELGALLEHAIDALPDIYRTAVVLRDVEGLSTAEAAGVLEVSEEVIKTRLRRAKLLLRSQLASKVESSFGAAFPFHAPRCDRVVSAVMARVAAVT